MPVLMPDRPQVRGWTRQPGIADILQRGMARFQAEYPASHPDHGCDPAHDCCHLLLTADEVLALQAWLPTPRHDHDAGPSWDACCQLARTVPELLIAGFLIPPVRWDEGIIPDAIYLPLPDPQLAGRTLAITRPDGTPRLPDEEGVEVIYGRWYRCLWWA